MKKTYSRRSFLDILGKGTAVAAMAYVGLAPLVNHCSHKDNETEDKLFYKQKDSLEKKVFIYNQDISSTVMEKETLDVADFWMPHLYDITIDKGDAQVTTRISNKTLDTLVTKARDNKVYVTPMISAFTQKSIQKVLSDPNKYAKIIADKIKSVPVQGIAIDFESVKVSKKESQKLVQFMAKLRKLLPKPYVISIATSPRFEGSAENGFKHHGFYDLEKLAPHVDYIHLMCYDFHKGKSGPSPVMPEDMLVKVLDYATSNESKIVRDKMTVLLPLYGHVWQKYYVKGKKDPVTESVGVLSSKHLEEFQDKFDEKSSKYVNGELCLETKPGKSGTEWRIAYVQDAEVFRRRFKLLDQYDIKSVGGWRQTHGTEEIYREFYRWKHKK